MSAQLRGFNKNKRGSSQGDQNANKRQKLSTSKSKGLTCPGCKENFPNFTTKALIIECHMMQDEECKKHIIHCPNKLCGQKFLSLYALDRHLRSKSNRSCLDADNEKNKADAFPHTNVEFPPSDPIDLSTSFPMSNNNFCQEVITRNNESVLFDVTDSLITKTPIATKKRSPQKSSKSSTSNRDLLPSTTIALDSEPSCSTDNMPKVTSSSKGRSMNKTYFRNTDGNKDDSDYYNSDTSIEDEFSGIEDEPTEDNLYDFFPICQSNEAIQESTTTDIHGNDTSALSSNATEAPPPNNPPENVDINELPSNLFLDIYETEEQEKDAFPEDVDFKNGINLLHLLISKRISLHRYTDFMKWKYDSAYKFPSFQDLIKSTTQKIYGPTLAERMSPEVSILQLPSGRRVPQVLFQVDAMVYDLLSDLDITSRKNLIFDDNATNPFQLKQSSVFADFDSSTYFTETMKSKNVNPENDVICPLVLYIDEIKLDAFGKLGLEPIVMSLMIYNRKTRNLSKAWRVIGYMPNFGSMFGKRSYSADQKAEDYHFCLSKVLDGIRRIQQNKNGYKWTFSFTNNEGEISKHSRCLHFPLAYVIGDAKGNDLLCGRYGSHHNTRCVGRDCDALTTSCDNPLVRCNFLRMSKLQEMNKANLAKLSFRKLNRNAFEDMWFGAQPYGINGCTPAEPLHQINLGILERLPEAFFARLTNKLLIVLDRHVAFTCTHFYRQSDRSFPDIFSFTSGISDVKRLTGREKLSRVFAIYLVLLSQDFKDEIVGSNGRVQTADEDSNETTIIDADEYNTWVNVFEETLLLTSWVYLASHPRIFFNGGRNSIAAKRLVQFVAMYKESAPRVKGMGLKIVKFHQLLHLWWVIKLYGSLLNVDGARGESIAIVATKEPGLHTQMRHILLNIQTASERFHRDIIIKCYNAIHNIEGSEMPEENSADDIDNGGIPIGSKFVVTFNYSSNTITTKWAPDSKMKSKACTFPSKLTAAIFNKLSHYNGGHVRKRIHQVCGFTEWKLEDQDDDNELHTIRACPSFRSRPWFDWGMVRWSTQETPVDIEAQVLMMLDMTTIKFQDDPPQPRNQHCLTNTPHNVIEPLQVAFIHSAKEGTKNNKSHNGRVSSIASWSEMESNYQMIDIRSIHSPCFVIVDKMDNENQGKYVPGHATEIISLLPKPMWSNKFLNYSDADLIEEALDKTDDSVTEQELKPYET